ncbi:MAG: ribose 5-phosphate isomerase A [Thermoprotei archaeon]|nr:MAG: ribose 5-phosphate isomerase A [Thermoprotei archaeon]
MKEKEIVGVQAADMVEDGSAVGLGTGSTAYYAIKRLGERVREGLNIVGVPTSEASARLAEEVGIRLGTLEEYPRIDITIDGADEVDPAFRLIKGMGGALLREKIVASVSQREVIIVDASKLVERLGTKSPLPVEVVPFGWKVCAERLRELGCEPVLRQGDGGVYTTDSGNYILDCRFDGVEDPEALERRINMIPGVVENGLFLGLATDVLVGREGRVEVLERRR